MNNDGLTEDIHIRIKKGDKALMKKDAKKNGLDNISSLLRWLWIQWRKKQKP